MPSRPASASPIERLIADLRSTDAVRRDAAVARLRVLGARALPRLVALIESSAGDTVTAHALAALEGIHDPRGMSAALACLDSPNRETVVAALGVLRGWVIEESGTRVLEAVTAIAVDRTRDARVRVAALDALSDLPDDLVGPIRAQAPPEASAGPALDDPMAAREWVEAHGGGVTLSVLHDSVKAFGEREASCRSSRLKAEWARARGAAHRALAERGSRLALYDARDTIGAAVEPLPAGFLDAVRMVGDASCLEPLARAWEAAPRGSAWRTELAGAARHIIGRAKLGGRSAILKGIRANWEGFV